jgi:2-keto-3-deoxy-L-rhamnonate aldolase RhmA
MDTGFRGRLLAGDRLIGTLISLPSPEVAELLAEVGFDWLFIDAEHGPLESERLQRLIQAIGGRAPALVRVPAGEDLWIKRALDVGAAGVIVPQVNSAEQAARVVGYCKYPPVGTRGVGIARAHRYGLGFSEYIATANDALAVIVQAEHIEAVRNIERIARVPGVDAVLIGPYDLSASMGKPGQITDPEVRQAMEAVREACLRAGTRLGIFGVSAPALRPFLDQEYTLITVGVDAIFLGQAAGAALSELRR